MPQNPAPRGPRYRFSIPEPWAHLVEVTLTTPVPTPGAPVEAWMAAWTPGSYLIREFSRHVERFRAEDAEGRPLPFRKTAKNRWSVEPGKATEIVIRYGVYCRELSVRTNFVDADLALLNGAPTYLLVAGLEGRPHEVTVEIPRSWAGVWTALDPAPSPATPAGGARAFSYTAPDHDTLLDSPLLAGNPAVHDLAVDGIPVSLVNHGEGGLWDGAAAARDLEKVVREYARLYGELPFPRYLFLNCIVEAGGGLEHKASSVLMTSRYVFRRRKTYADWVGLASHEFFHVWNVKRSRPQALGPFDYEREAYTRSLWVAEGVTNYYTDLMPCRAGVTSESEYLEFLSEIVERTEAAPGRRLHSLEDASFDAWIKYYRPDENTANTSVNYYQKGAVAAWLLDTEIRRATEGERSLDDLLRLLFRRHAGERGYADEDVQRAAEEVAGVSLGAFFSRVVRGTQDLDYGTALDFYGLRFRDPHEGEGKDAPTAWLGVETKSVDGRLVVASVHREGPARAAGLNAEDEVLAVGGYRVTPVNFRERLLQFAAGERVEFLVARRDAVRILPVTLAPHPGTPWRLAADPQATDVQVANRRAWLGKGAAPNGEAGGSAAAGPGAPA